jgi:hypothetical protein
MDTYYINEQVFTSRSNIFSCVIEAYCPDRPSEKSMTRSIPCLGMQILVQNMNERNPNNDNSWLTTEKSSLNTNKLNDI